MNFPTIELLRNVALLSLSQNLSCGQPHLTLQPAVLSVLSAVKGCSQYPGAGKKPHFQNAWHCVHLQHQGPLKQPLVGRHLLDALHSQDIRI